VLAALVAEGDVDGAAEETAVASGVPDEQDDAADDEQEQHRRAADRARIGGEGAGEAPTLFEDRRRDRYRALGHGDDNGEPVAGEQLALRERRLRTGVRGLGTRQA